jgi:GxxExxY protein
MNRLIHEDVTFEIIGAAMEVHRILGPGFLEAVYQRSMEVELRQRGLEFNCQRRVVLRYKGEALGEHVLDLVVDGKVVVELKAVKEMNDQHRAQLISYLKAAQLPVGLLINFAATQLQYKRFLLTPNQSV